MIQLWTCRAKVVFRDALYWVFTGLLTVSFAFSSIPDIALSADAVKIFNQLRLPGYLIQFVGVAKMLALVAILIPGFPRLKEWAYAGLVFDLTGAVFAFIATGVPVVNILPMALFYIFIAGSYIYYHKRISEGKLDRQS